MEGDQATVCVTGAGGYIGSWLVMRLLERGYTVRATVLDPNDMNEVKHLLELPKAETHLSLWKADLGVEGSFDEAIHGCSGVFHLATVMNFGSQDPENEVIKPTVEGMISIMKSCTKGKVKKLVFTSSAAAVDIQPLKKQVYDETCWSDTHYIRTTKMTAWTYFLSKTLAEQAAWKYAQENELNLITIMPTVVVGPFLIPSMPPSFTTSLSLLTGNEGHYSILKDGHFIHLDDLCMAHIFLYEHPEAKGRYICNSVDETIHTLAKLLKDKYPDYNIPTQFEGVDEEVKVRFSSKKLREIGFEFKYNLEEMFVGAIDSCRHKGLLPLPTPIPLIISPTPKLKPNNMS